MLDFKILKFYAIRADFCAEGGGFTYTSLFPIVSDGPLFFRGLGQGRPYGRFV
ncbi:hypothetical protein AL1_24080 [Alistipes shahii WAL 8301]|uniref:Uncharacterized protein n=1 Tax=Alistipes shahii WAL 8301 TaxID=717959 RepID=D4INY1_9BACT|nr:hypothetical protein AL1_24080 [Alistipes shahii WAL 8301]